MAAQAAESSPRLKARMAGIVYLLNFLTAVPVALASRLFVSGDAAATSNNILAHRPLFWFGLAGLTMNVATYIVVTLFFYELFQSVNKSLSLLAAFFSLVGCAIQSSACVFYVAPSVALGNDRYLSVFTLSQTQAVAFMFLKMYTHAYNIGLPFFGCYCLLIGFLILRSIFMPRILGALMMVGGCGWLTFISPPLTQALSRHSVLPGFVAELSLTLWLLVMAVNEERWKQQASTGGMHT